jgi:limonene-1,2-epoxide hydrolase
MHSQQVQIVLDFIDCWHRLDLDDALSRIAPDAVFVPDLKSQAVRGREAIREVWADYLRRIARYDADILNLAGTGNVVFVERIERLSMPDGRSMVLPITAVFELDDAGRITAWRDYWDTSMAPPPPAQ